MSAQSRSTAVDYPTQVLEQFLLGDIVSHCLAPLALLLILLITVDGLIPQVEMFQTGGDMPIPTFVVKAVFMLVVAFAAALNNGWRNELLPIWAWCLFTGYLTADIPHIMAQRVGLVEAMSGYYLYYSLILILPFMGAFAGRLRTQSIIRTIYGVFWLCAAMGIAQRITNLPLLRTTSSDGSFEVLSWTLFGTGLVRSFSFFVSGVNFGLFCTLAGVIGLYSFLERRTRIGSLAVFVTAVFCVYCTLTRVVYLTFALAVVTILFLRYVKRRIYLSVLPLVGLGISGLIAYGGVFYLNGNQGIADNVSLLERMSQMAYYWSMYIHGNLVQKLFGLGFIYSSKANGQDPTALPIDNVFMALLVHIGLVGVLIVLLLFWMIYRRMGAMAAREPNPLHAGVYALWSSFLGISLFDISIAFFACSAMLMMLGADAAAETMNRIRAAGE